MSDLLNPARAHYTSAFLTILNLSGAVTTKDGTDLRSLADELAGAVIPRCNMTHTPPMDFAQCETHDTTFALGDVCKFHERDPIDVLQDEADEQRGRAVIAEERAARAEEDLERARTPIDPAHECPYPATGCTRPGCAIYAARAEQRAHERGHAEGYRKGRAYAAATTETTKDCR